MQNKGSTVGESTGTGFQGPLSTGKGQLQWAMLPAVSCLFSKGVNYAWHIIYTLERVRSDGQGYGDREGLPSSRREQPAMQRAGPFGEAVRLDVGSSPAVG